MDVVTRAEVEHCQHCRPTWDWIENQEGKPPQVVFTGFPRAGVMVMSKARVIVLCGSCSLSGLPEARPDN